MIPTNPANTGTQSRVRRRRHDVQSLGTRQDSECVVSQLPVDNTIDFTLSSISQSIHTP
jgi:hypothetical protein